MFMLAIAIILVFTPAFIAFGYRRHRVITCLCLAFVWLFPWLWIVAMLFACIGKTGKRRDQEKTIERRKKKRK